MVLRMVSEYLKKEHLLMKAGDRGYDNWAMRGWFERTGDDEKTVNFHRP